MYYRLFPYTFFTFVRRYNPYLSLQLVKLLLKDAYLYEANSGLEIIHKRQFSDMLPSVYIYNICILLGFVHSYSEK